MFAGGDGFERQRRPDLGWRQQRHGVEPRLPCKHFAEAREGGNALDGGPAGACRGGEREARITPDAGDMLVPRDLAEADEPDAVCFLAQAALPRHDEPTGRVARKVRRGKQDVVSWTRRLRPRA